MKFLVQVLGFALICLIYGELCEVKRGEKWCPDERVGNKYDTSEAQSNKSHRSRKLLSTDDDKKKKEKLDLKRISAEFDASYACLKRQQETHKAGVTPIHAELYQEGMSVTLTCEVCPRPDQRPEEMRIHWRRRLVLKQWVQELVSIDHEKFIVTPNNGLVIHGLSLDDSGQYICFKGNEHVAVHHMDVVKLEKVRKSVTEGLEGNSPYPVQILKENNLMVFTDWSEWGQCSKCDGSGQRQRIGTCTIKKLIAEEAVHPHDMPMLNHYPGGVPCRSSLIPPVLASLEQIRDRKSETLLSYCVDPCPTIPALTTITDEDGNVIEVVETGKGVVSMRAGKPKLPPMVKRKTLYQEVRSPLIMSCPSEQAFYEIVRWQNGTSVLNPLLIKRHTRGRVRIDPKNRLRVLRLRMWDSNVYSCWINDEHIASIKLRVIEKNSGSWNDYVIIGGVAMTVLVLLLIACKVAKMQRARAKALK